MTDKELIYAFNHGTTDLMRTKVVMQSERFVIFRVPGHNDWSGVGMRSYYASHTVLATKGMWCFAGAHVKEEWYGRVSKKTLKAALDLAEKTGKITRAEHGDFMTGARE